jgi:hypothetical protein
MMDSMDVTAAGEERKQIQGSFTSGWRLLKKDGIDLRLIEDHGVEAVAGEEAGVVVELDRLVIGLGDGEGDGGEAGKGEVVDAVLEEREAEALPAIGAGDAELRDVGDVAGYAGAEQHSDDGCAVFVAEEPGGGGIEHAAAGEADDVVEETQ